MLSKILKIFFLLLVSHSALAASFDCQKASSGFEKLLCADSQLSKLDDQLNMAYKTAFLATNDDITLKNSQQMWLQKVQSCADVACIKTFYMARINDLQSLANLSSENRFGRFARQFIAAARTENIGEKMSSDEGKYAGNFPIWTAPILYAPSDFDGNPDFINTPHTIYHDYRDCGALAKEFPSVQLSNNSHTSFKDYAKDPSIATYAKLQPLNATCEALAIIKYAKPAKYSALRNIDLQANNFLTQITPLAYAINQCRMNCAQYSANRFKMTWNDFETLAFNKRWEKQQYYLLPPYKIDDNRFLVAWSVNKKPEDCTDIPDCFSGKQKDNGGFFSDIQVIAKGDFIGNGWEQWLVQVTYNNTWPLIVSNQAIDPVADSNHGFFLVTRYNDQQILSVINADSAYFTTYCQPVGIPQDKIISARQCAEVVHGSFPDVWKDY